MKNFILKLFLLVTAIFFIYIAKAQKNDTIEIRKNEKGIIRFGSFRNIKSNGTDTIFLKSLLGAKQDDEFRKTREEKDTYGFIHKRFQQYFKGVKVYGAEYLVHERNDSIKTVNGNFESINISSVAPALDEQDALSKALSYVGAKKYKWQDDSYQSWIKQNKKDSSATFYPKGELVIAKDYISKSNDFKLAWQFTISTEEPDDEILIFVDAQNGNLLSKRSLDLDANTQGTAQTKYNGTQNITVDNYNGSYRLRENRNGVNIVVLNCLSQSNYTNAVDFTNSSTNFTNGNWANFNTDQPALDVAWGFEKILDFWKNPNTFNRNSLNNAGLPLTGYTHYYQANSSAGWPNNAQWDGNNHVMRFGDGDGITFNPVVALDVTAHETGHGICEFTANLGSQNQNQEQDALNEG